MGKHRKFSAEEKLKIVMEGLKEGNKISEVCRRHDIHSSQFYDWKEKAMLGAKEGLKPKRNGKSKKLKRKDEKLNQLKEIVADLKVENELLKKTTSRTLR